MQSDQSIKSEMTAHEKQDNLYSSESAANLSGLTFTVITFGCQMNKHDSERIVGMLEEKGARWVDTIPESDIVVFMTCCVRENAEQRLKGQAASLKNIPLRSASPLSKRVVAIGGCIGQNEADHLVEELPHVSVVFGTFNLSSVPDLISKSIQSFDSVVEVLDEADEFPTTLATHRARPWAAWLPISIGCNNFCSYCIVPYVRGREKSLPMQDIVNDAQKLVDEGVKEITLLGQNVNSYGRDLYGKPQFAALLDAVAQTKVERIFFATSHPKDLNDEVIAAFKNCSNLMPALHLPVQSGSNRILKLMNRRYTREHYLSIIEKLRNACPEIALSTDIIVGFPGETEEDFEETYELVKQIGFHQVFTFIYSPRTGTPAALRKQNSTQEEIQDRFNRLVEVVQSSAYEANQKDLNQTTKVLFEGPSKRNESLVTGKSEKNQTVHVPLPPEVEMQDLQGQILNVKIDEAHTWYLRGHIID